MGSLGSLPSAKFRKTFPRLSEPVLVTSHGHLLGTWVPGEDLLPWARQLRTEIATAEAEHDTIDNDVVAERDALRLEVEYLNSRLAGAARGEGLHLP